MNLIYIYDKYCRIVVASMYIVGLICILLSIPFDGNLLIQYNVFGEMWLEVIVIALALPGIKVMFQSDKRKTVKRVKNQEKVK